MKIHFYKIPPIPKPRMTQADKKPDRRPGRPKWRPCVVRYRTFENMCIANRVVVPKCNSHIIFFLPMPRSWSKKKREKFYLMPHRQKPDRSNLVKAIEDATTKNDQDIFDLRASKFWANIGAILIIEDAHNVYDVHTTVKLYSLGV